MSCTTILAGKGVTWNGSTMIARNDDSGSGHFTPKKFVVVEPEEQPREYESVLSHVKIPLPDDPQRYTAMPNALKGDGIWAACGVNASDVAMSATETITSNPRVLGADPLVEYQKEEEDPLLHFGTDQLERETAGADFEGEKPGGIGEEDLVVLTLPYIKTAREGVLRLGALLEKYGTYEENGIAFSDENEVWWLETIGGHHWIAKRVEDNGVVVMPNQLGIDDFDLTDAFSGQKYHLCSPDLKEFIAENHLNLSVSYGEDGRDIYILEEDNHEVINPRILFGSHEDADHVYNTPRAWYMLRCLIPSEGTFDGPDAEFKPWDDDLPWQVSPDRKLTPEDVKYILSSHYQGTQYDPYLSYGDKSHAGAFRSIGINRNDFLGFAEIRPDMPEGTKAIEWVAFGSNAFNVMAPFYTYVSRIPAYLSNTTEIVSTDNFYWSSRLIAAMADASFGKCQNVIEQYTDAVMSKAHALLNKWDRKIRAGGQEDRAGGQSDGREDHAGGQSDGREDRAGGQSGVCEEGCLKDHIAGICEAANEEIAAMLKKETDKALARVLEFRSNEMKNSYARSDH